MKTTKNQYKGWASLNSPIVKQKMKECGLTNPWKGYEYAWGWHNKASAFIEQKYGVSISMSKYHPMHLNYIPDGLHNCFTIYERVGLGETRKHPNSSGTDIFKNPATTVVCLFKDGEHHTLNVIKSFLPEDKLKDVLRDALLNNGTGEELVENTWNVIEGEQGSEEYNKNISKFIS